MNEVKQLKLQLMFAQRETLKANQTIMQFQIVKLDSDIDELKKKLEKENDDKGRNKP